jgi:hypothetical protein
MKKKQTTQTLQDDKCRELAKKYNGKWTPNWDDMSEPKWYIRKNVMRSKTDDYLVADHARNMFSLGTVYFKSKEDADKAIEELVKK